ncbi:Transmembrane protein 165 [Acipenser ruthenus]|uniref:GDT1 family protein n=1 Tax=Acipenser ruthenus TaxID=7906 RepID=A0A662YSA8_ACIRT|nr:Transmembrane protein 165 [Acipenser ruthenus]
MFGVLPNFHHLDGGTLRDQCELLGDMLTCGEEADLDWRELAMEMQQSVPYLTKAEMTAMELLTFIHQNELTNIKVLESTASQRSIKDIFGSVVRKLPTQLLIGPAVGEDAATKGNLGFIHAFVAAISVIIVSELGDKTFFIAAIMAMRYNRLTVLAGAMLALGVMTCLSVLFGYATTIIPRIYTYYVSTALFAIFGIRMLREGFKMSPDEGQEELEEVQAEIKKKDEELQRSKLVNSSPDVEAGAGSKMPQKSWHSIISPIFVQAFTLTFLAEWGDRSQLTTIVLAAREACGVFYLFACLCLANQELYRCLLEHAMSKLIW